MIPLLCGCSHTTAWHVPVLYRIMATMEFDGDFDSVIGADIEDFKQYVMIDWVITTMNLYQLYIVQ